MKGPHGNGTKRGNTWAFGLKGREEKVSLFYFSFIYTFSKYIFQKLFNFFSLLIKPHSSKSAAA
jgi:hypothetical protein